MDELSTTLLDRLIEKTFDNMTQDEKLAFVERLFVEMPADGQERFLRRMIQHVSGPKPGPARRPPFMRRHVLGHEIQDIGPWRHCWRVMAEMDRAAALEGLDTAEPARLFNALADETRLKLVKLLTEHERRVDELTHILDTAQSTVSHHLRILREAGLVRGDKRGRSVYYSLTRPVIIEEQD